MLTKRNYKTFLASLILFLILTLYCEYSFADQESLLRKKNYVKESSLFKTNAIEDNYSANINNRQIIIKLKTGFWLDIEAMQLVPVLTPDILKEDGIFLAKIPEELDYYGTIEKLSTLKEIDYITPDLLYQPFFTPNDEYYNQQWSLPKLNLPQAWDISQGSSDVVVAVLDSGIDFNHSDLQGKIVGGYDYLNNDTIPEDNMGHGTMVAGIIAAVTNNGYGIAGITSNCKIMPIKIGDASGFPLSAVISGIKFAIQNKADIINMSYGSQYSYDSEKNAIWDAVDNNILLVASSGNNGRAATLYPAGYPPVISVGATDSTDNRAAFSNYGLKLDLVAPGVEILSTTIDNSYSYGSGTSFSAPITSGIAALLLSKYPDLTPSELEWIIEKTARNLKYNTTEWDYTFGYGIPDTYEAFVLAESFYNDDGAGNGRITATPICLNNTYREKLNIPLDDDWYTFHVNKALDLTITITAPPNIDVVAWIDGTELKETPIDSKSIGGTEVYKFRAAAGTYYLHIYDNFNHWSEEPYTLDVFTNNLDLNQDGHIDLNDVFLLSEVYGTNSADPNWNNLYDINPDNNIDIYDLALMASFLP